MKRIIFILVALLSVSVMLADKSQQSIKKQQQRTNKEIKETAKKIETNKKQTKKQLNLLNKLTVEISQNTQELNQLQTSIDSLDKSMRKMTDSIAFLEKRLVLIRENYKKSLRSVRASRHSTSNIAFIFSSKSFDDAYRRMRYLQQFNTWQTNKANEVKEAITAIENAKNELVALHSTKSKTLELVATTQKTLVKNQQEQSQVVASLQKERTQLDAYLKKKQKEAQKLDDQLNELIRKQQEEERKRRIEAEKKRKEKERLEAEKRRKEQEQKEKEQPKKGQQPSKPVDSKKEEPKKQPEQPIVDTEEQAQQTLSSNFENNKGKLPYPATGKCRIVSKFGRHKHPSLQYVEVNNNGIDIELLSSTSAIAVCDGTVSAIFQQSGYNNIVMVRHGSYITVYANLATITVKPGDKVKARQAIGTVYADPDDDNRCILHFEVRKETQKLNPEHWIK